MEETFDLLTIALLPGATPRRLGELRARGPLRTVLERPEDHADLLAADAVAALRSGAATALAEAQLAGARRAGLRVLGLDEPDYPALLRRIYDPPLVLFVRGTLASVEPAPALAIVGARAATPAGCVLARELARQLAAAGVTIVSGLARGIDAAAHAGALEAGGRTLAVLGSGLDVVYPAEHAGLAESIARSGAVVSELPLGTPPRPAQFPARNRILAGWGLAVVVVEAGRRSGALITARCALEEGREVLAVPGHPAAPLAAGTNALIRDGARLVRDAADVAEELGLALSPTQGPTRDAVLDALARDRPASLEEIEATSGLGPAELLARLSLLEIERRVRRLPGALYVRN